MAIHWFQRHHLQLNRHSLVLQQFRHQFLQAPHALQEGFPSGPAKPPGVAAKAIEWTKGIEVNQFVNGGLKKFSNFPILLTEATATIACAEQLSNEVFSGKKVVLLDNDNLPIPETSASRGKLLWTLNTLYVNA